MRVTLQFMIGIWLSLVALDAFAEDSRNYSPYFNGSFVEVSVRGAQNFDDANSLGFDLGFRHSFPMLLLDSRVSWRYDDFDETRHGLHYGFGAHPLYMFLLGNSWLSYVVSSFYLELGAGVDFQSSGIGPALTLGAGLDFPLWDADAGHSPWLNALYRHHWSFTEASIDTHMIFLGLAWRRNGLLF